MVVNNLLLLITIKEALRVMIMYFFTNLPEGFFIVNNKKFLGGWFI